MTNKDELTLLTACLQGKEHKALQCLDQGCNVNVQEDGTGSTPLHKASRGGHKNIVIMLLEHGANKYVRNNQDKLASEIAKTKEISEIIHHYHRTGQHVPLLRAKPRSPRIDKHVHHRRDTSDRDFHLQVHYRLMQQQKAMEKQQLIIEDQRRTISNIQREQNMMKRRMLDESDLQNVWQHLRERSSKISVYDLLQTLMMSDERCQ